MADVLQETLYDPVVLTLQACEAAICGICNQSTHPQISPPAFGPTAPFCCRLGDSKVCAFDGTHPGSDPYCHSHHQIHPPVRPSVVQASSSHRIPCTFDSRPSGFFLDVQRYEEGREESRRYAAGLQYWNCTSNLEPRCLLRYKALPSSHRSPAKLWPSRGP